MNPPDRTNAAAYAIENFEAADKGAISLPTRLHLTLGDWAARDLPPPDCLMGYWLTTTSRVLLVAPTGLGKTNLGIALGYRVAGGRDFLHWRANRSARVLFIDGEMSKRLFKKRLCAETDRNDFIPETFFALSHEDIEGFAPLNTPAGQACIEALIERLGGVDLIIFDSIMCLTAGDMKDGEAWAKTMPWVRSLTKRNIGQIWLHHTGHDESRSYGDKTKEWQLDTVIHAQSVERVDTDVSFSIEFRKAREREPETRADFQSVRIALIDDQWIQEGAAALRPGHVSPLGLKFLDALLNVLATAGIQPGRNRPAASLDAWKEECLARGLLDPKKEHSGRTLINKHRRELIAANRIACEGEMTWTL